MISAALKKKQSIERAMDKFCYHEAILADIGATNARFCFLSEQGEFEHVHISPCKDFMSFSEAFDTYVQQNKALSNVKTVSLAVAAPITGDHIDMTNHPWFFSIKRVQAKLYLKTLSAINDFTAVAQSIPSLCSDDYQEIGLSQDKMPDWPMAVIGPGTGLGVSGLAPKGDGTYFPLKSEGGHVTLAASNEWEGDVIRLLRQKFGHVSAERVLSGQGIVNLYEAISMLHNKEHHVLTPQQITHRAEKRLDTMAERTMEAFCDMLATVAGNLVLSLGALGGVYLAGGILPKMIDFFDKDRFYRRFTDKGRYAEYLSHVPIRLITHPYPAFLGLRTALIKRSI